MRLAGRRGLLQTVEGSRANKLWRPCGASGGTWLVAVATILCLVLFVLCSPTQSVWHFEWVPSHQRGPDGSQAYASHGRGGSDPRVRGSNKRGEYQLRIWGQSVASEAPRNQKDEGSLVDVEDDSEGPAKDGWAVTSWGSEGAVVRTPSQLVRRIGTNSPSSTQPVPSNASMGSRSRKENRRMPAKSRESARPRTHNRFPPLRTRGRADAVPAPVFPKYPNWGVQRIRGWSAEEVKDQVREAFKHAWSAYRRHAWGHDELRPINRHHKDFNGLDMGLTIVDSVDTAVVMGLEDEYLEARQWIKHNLDFSNLVHPVSFFEVTIRYLGGLLGTYYLTGDDMFLVKAVDIGDRLAMAFKTPTGLPSAEVQLADGKLSNSRPEGLLLLAELGTCQLEMAALSRLTGNSTYSELADRAEDVVLSLDSYHGLKLDSVEQSTLKLTGKYSMGGASDSYYEYLLKRHIQSAALGEPAEVSLKYGKEYARVARTLSDLLARKSVHGLTFLVDLLNERTVELREMNHLACFVPGMLALGTLTNLYGEQQDSMLKLGSELARTCYIFYNTTRTGLSPENVAFPVSYEQDIAPTMSVWNILRPETVESFFVLHRITGEQKYRDWGMDIFTAWETYSKIPGGGYSGLNNVSVAGSFTNRQESFFLAESLKYLYLLFDDSNDIGLGEWVFNTEAHPLSLDPNWNAEDAKQRLTERFSRKGTTQKTVEAGL